MTKKILYIQHAGSLGGSCMSLLYLSQGLDRGKYKPVVACIHPTPEVLNLYREAGIETLYWPGISPFEHTTLGWMPLYNPFGLLKLVRQSLRFMPSVYATQALIGAVKPNIVHLNSLVLAPSALGVRRAGVPLVWHVREPVHLGHAGLRKRLLSRLFMRLADEGVFISQFDRDRLTGEKKGVVVYNFVDFKCFDYHIDGKPIRYELGLPSEAKVILYLGGQSVVKGIFPLLRAMPLVKQQIPNVHLLVGAGAYHFSGRFVSRLARTILPLIGSGTVAQRVDRLIEGCPMQNNVQLLEWRSDTPQLLAACDVLVFPSIEPHFARPIIEAGAMAKPVVASRIGGVEELVEDGKTGVLVPPGDFEALAKALIMLLNNVQTAQQMGKEGYQHALRLFDATNNVQAVVRIYDRMGDSLDMWPAVSPRQE
ncbi:MAG: glycosyltransferase family 4 protein [Aggregatilineales bacterium]